MHLFILGATGRTGTHAYKYALDQGHHVTALVRNASKIEPQENLTVVEGSPTSEADINKAFSASSTPFDAALQFLNPLRASDFPWSQFLSPPRLLADSTALTAKALRKQQKNGGHRLEKPRLVVMSALGAGKSRGREGVLMRLLIDYSSVKKTYEDHDLMNEEIVQNCGDDVIYTLAFPTGLTGAGDSPVKTYEPTQTGAGFFIRRESCAKWLIDAATGTIDQDLDNKGIILSN